MTTLNELMSVARRSSVVNHLKNGNFLNVPKQATAINNYGNVRGYSKVFRTNYTYDVTTGIGAAQSVVRRLRVPGFHVQGEEPDENFIGFWSVWGAAGVISFNDVAESFDGGNLVGVEFSESGVIQFRQSVNSFDKFRGKTVSVALSGRAVKGDTKIILKIDTGTEILESRPFFSRYFGEYSRMIIPLKVGLDITKFDVLITIDALQHAVVGISGAMLAIGPYQSMLPYADSPSDASIPSGTIVLQAGTACPPGYRSVADDGYLFVHMGDPNAFRGNLNSKNDNIEITHDTEIGQNKHDHQASGANELQPAAFDVLGGEFETPPVDEESTPINSEVRPVQ